MKSQTIKKLQILFYSGALMLLLVFSACNQDNKNNEHDSINMDNTNQEHQSMIMDNTQIDSSIIRKGVIDVEMIDKNKDGMVYQDPMDWNVISDEPGKCPLCKMTLEEVSIKDAKENLVQNGYEVK